MLIDRVLQHAGERNTVTRYIRYQSKVNPNSGENFIDSIVVLELMSFITVVGVHTVNTKIHQGMCASCSELLSLPSEI